MGCPWNDDSVLHLAIGLLAVNAQLSPAIPLAIDPNRLVQFNIPALILLVDLTDIRLTWYIHAREIELAHTLKEIRGQFTRHNGRFAVGSSYLKVTKLQTCLPEPGDGGWIALFLHLDVRFIVCAYTVSECVIARAEGCLCEGFDKGGKEEQVLFGSGVGCRVEYRIANDGFKIVLGGSNAILPVFSQWI